MHLRSLYLQQFRNFPEVYFEFSQGVNLICGPNAQGKTTVLEAIHTLMFGKSFRPGMNQDLIHSGASSFYVEALFCKHAIDQKLRLYFDEKERKIFHNSTPLPVISNLLGLMQGIVMTPDDVNLIKGPPAQRRQFLDIQLAQADPLYVHFLGRYAKAMRQRNQLLKQKKLHSIESWEHEMAQSAAYLILQRRKCTDKLQVNSQKYYSYLTGESEDLTLEYRSTALECKEENEIKNFYHYQYRKNREREMMLGTTLSGPHRDDFSIAIRSRDARFFASEGQQRSCVAALHLGEWQSLKETAEEIPLFMIDDIGISLDDQRRTRLLDLLSSMGQVFITSTDESLLSSLSCPKKNHFTSFGRKDECAIARALENRHLASFIFFYFTKSMNVLMYFSFQLSAFKGELNKSSLIFSILGKIMIRLFSYMLALLPIMNCYSVLFVGIAGPTGSGKTTFAEKIKDAVPEALLIHQDAYYRDLSHLPFEQREEVNYDHPDALDFALLKEHLITLRNGLSIEQPIYNFQNHTQEEKTKRINSSPIIIVEGILLLAVPEIRDLLDIKIYIETDDEIRLLRRIQRDMTSRQRTFSSIKKQYLQTVKPMQDLFVKPSKKYADFLVPGENNDIALEYIVSRLKQKLH